MHFEDLHVCNIVMFLFLSFFDCNVCMYVYNIKTLRKRYLKLKSNRIDGIHTKLNYLLSSFFKVLLITLRANQSNALSCIVIKNIYILRR